MTFGPACTSYSSACARLSKDTQAGRHPTGVTVLNLCSGMEAMLEDILREGFKVKGYHHCDTGSVAAQVMIRRLGGLKMQSPSQLGTSAVTRAFVRMSGDTTGIRQSHLKEIVQQMVATHSFILAGGGFTCQELSAAGGTKKTRRTSRWAILPDNRANIAATADSKSRNSGAPTMDIC